MDSNILMGAAIAQVSRSGRPFLRDSESHLPVTLVPPLTATAESEAPTDSDRGLFAHFTAPLRNVDMHYVVAGRGDPVVLLHGWPQSWYAWRHVIPLLATRHTVIAPDLRGSGDSSAPVAGYDKLTLAGDVHELLTETLGFRQFDLVGHDWGGVTAFMLAAGFPDCVQRLAVVDVVVPGLGTGCISQGGKRWHHAFHQTPGLPELLVSGREEEYLGWFFDNFGAQPGAISSDDATEYVRNYRSSSTKHAGFEYYRATPQDEADVRRLTAGRTIDIPILAVGGGESWGRGGDVAEALSTVAGNVERLVVPDTGHWIPEEQPSRLADELLRFFA